MKRLGWLALVVAGCSPTADLRIGSKADNEGAVLGELAVQLARSVGTEPTFLRKLGGTPVLWQALRSGAIDIYPEYTGTITRQIFPDRSLPDAAAIRTALDEFGLAMSKTLGFTNNYAVGMKAERARDLGVRSLSDLARQPQLILGFSSEFVARADGWPALRDHYRLPQTRVRGMEHTLAYKGLADGSLDATDVYTTDAEIARFSLVVLDDDRGFFPRYDAVLLYRLDAAERHPAALAAIRRLEGAIDQETMIALNARVQNGEADAEVAAEFLRSNLGVRTESRAESAPARLLRLTGEHLTLVGISLVAAIVVAIPLGIVAAARPQLGQILLGAAGIAQTIPSLALLVFMIPLLGLGAKPAIAALFLYSLLPVMRNTATGLTDIPASLRESAEGLGLSRAAILGRIELPLASRSILAGIKTAAVINVGTATLGALIGAGGFGQPIQTGIQLHDTGLILQGAVPAAVLALLAQGSFEVLERLVVPQGLRLPRTT